MTGAAASAAAYPRGSPVTSTIEGLYFHAVLEASKSVADKLRTKTGEDGDGSPLVDATYSLNSGPRIAFNNLATEWERSEQTGIAMLMKGLFSTFRNPTAHAPKVLWATSSEGTFVV